MAAEAPARQIDAGLWRWAAPHPEWEPAPEPESPADWPQDVGSVLYESTDGAAVFIDPQLPPAPQAFWDWADERVRGKSVLVLTTIRWHGRSREAVEARYRSDAWPADRGLPEGVELLPFDRAAETMVWLPERRALVPGDRIIGTSAGGLRLCPESWLRYLEDGVDLDDLRAELQPLLALPVERVLVSHGEPVTERAAAALAHAFA
jgi:hypothetical protein